MTMTLEVEAIKEVKTKDKRMIDLEGNQQEATLAIEARKLSAKLYPIPNKTISSKLSKAAIEARFAVTIPIITAKAAPPRPASTLELITPSLRAISGRTRTRNPR